MTGRIFAALALIAALSQAGVVYPQALIVDTVEEIVSGDYAVSLHSNAGFSYATVTDMDDLEPGDLMAVILYCNGTTDDVRDDTVLVMRYTGFHDETMVRLPGLSLELLGE